MLTVASLTAIHSKVEADQAPPPDPDEATDRQLIKLMELMYERLPRELYDEDHLEAVVGQGKRRVSQAIDNLMKRRPLPKDEINKSPGQPNRYTGHCLRCNLQVLAGEGLIAWDKDRNHWGAVHRDGECAVTEFPFPYGRYAVDTDEGHLAFYQALETGLYVQASDELHLVRGKAQHKIIDKISADPQAASIRYGLELKVCGRCGRTLTNEDSRAMGIGPECAKKGWEAHGGSSG